MKLRRPSPSAFAWFVALIVLAVLGWLVRSDVRVAGAAFRSLQPAYVAGGLALVLGALVNQAGFHAAAQRAAGEDVTARDVLVPVAASGFLNLVVKSGAMAGLAPMVTSARRRGKSAGPTVAGYLVVNVLGHIGFAVALSVGVVVLVVDGRFTWVEAGAAGLFVILSAAQIGVIIAATRSREFLRRLFLVPSRLRRWLRRLARRDHSLTLDECSVAPFDVRVEASSSAWQRADELHDAVSVLRSNPRRATRAFVHALAVEGIGMAQLWCVLRSLHVSVGFGLPVTAYAVSVLFVIVGVLPGGLGFVEAGLGTLLVSSGVARGDAVAAVVLYRVLELWLPALLGLVATRRLAVGVTA